MREVANEADCVRQRVNAAVGGGVPAHRGIKSREQRVLDQGTSARDAVEQRRLAGVGVARDSDRRNLVAVAVRPFRLSCGSKTLDLLAQSRHPGVDAASIELDLRFTGATASHSGTRATDLATGLARH